MKGGGKDEGKAMEPLFPRLHVNDREKGGPRAPPRNKMALYEQLSIPSKRFSSSSSTPSPALDKAGSPPPPPPPPQSSGIQAMVWRGRGVRVNWSLVRVTESFAFDSEPRWCILFVIKELSKEKCRVGGWKVMLFASSTHYALRPTTIRVLANGHDKFNMSPKPHSNSEDRIHSRLSERASLNTTREDFGRSFKRHASNNTVNVGGLASAECTSRHLSGPSDAKKSRENFEDEDDFRVPTFVQTVIAAFSNYDLPAVRQGKPTISHVERSQKRCSYPLPNCNEKPFKEKYTNTISRNSESEQNCKETSVFAHSPEIRDPKRLSELSNWNKTSLDRTGTVEVDKHACHANKELHLESCADGYPSGSRCSNRVDVVEEEDNSRNIIASCSKASLGEKADKFDQETHDESNRQPQLGDGDRDEVSEASLDYIAGMGMMISPDDVVGVIGTKHFWKARRAIVNQQRVFAIQVFELHRLIKVQKLIAASPDVIMTDVYVKPSPAKMVSENLPPEDVRELPPPLDNIGNSHQQTIEQNDSSQKLNLSTGCPEENPVRDPPQEDISSIGVRSVDSAPDNRTNAYCFHPPPNQWLVPVMSPSEGLIYKPYSGPCPPIPGFMAPPFYGGCAPHGFQPAAGDFMNSAYGALPYQPPPNYFPSFYSLPMEKPMFSSSAVEQVIPSAGSQPNGREFQQARSSCVVSHPSREAISGRVRKFQASKDSEVQGSTVSSSNPREEEQRPLFHKPGAFVAMDQTSESCRGDGQNRVIKVVPHNAGSATESAARIFRSIQRERQQYKS